MCVSGEVSVDASKECVRDLGKQGLKFDGINCNVLEEGVSSCDPNPCLVCRLLVTTSFCSSCLSGVFGWEIEAR